MDVSADLRACLDDWGDAAVIRGKSVKGYFTSRPIDQGAGEEAVYGMAHIYGCAKEDAAALAEGDAIEVVGRGRFRVLRVFGPFETGLVEIQLGAFL
jgi:hypothetical protein